MRIQLGAEVRAEKDFRFLQITSVGGVPADFRVPAYWAMRRDNGRPFPVPTKVWGIR